MKVLASLFVVVLCCFPSVVCGQSFTSYDFKSSYALDMTYSPNSSHILIGDAVDRKITTLGFEYSRNLFHFAGIKFEYAGEISPLYRENDPTIIALSETYNNVTTISPLSAPSRTINSPTGSQGNDCVTHYPACVPVYGIQGPDEITYGFATEPFGLRAVFLPKKRIQPTFMANAGLIITQRSIPIDGAALFNYQFSMGPGVQIFTSRRTSLGLEYFYRHISNGNATINPGIDQGVFRLSFKMHR